MRIALVILALFATMLFGILALGNLSCQREPATSSKANIAEKSYTDHCDTQYAIFKSGFNEIWTFTKDSEHQLTTIATVIIALFTIILGVATILLANATKALVVDAKNTAEWQLRAYVNVRFKHLHSFDETIRASVKYKIRNIGKTPARAVVNRADIFVVPRPLPEGYVMPAIGTPPPTEIVVFPGQKFDCEAVASTTFTIEELNRVRDGSAQIYAAAEIFYDDVFGNPHRTFSPVLIQADTETLTRITTNYGRSDLKISFSTAPGTAET